MKSYRIHFFNDLANDCGQLFHCKQRTIEIRAARSKDRALEAAKLRFARREQIGNWALHARSIDIEEISPA